MEHPKYEASIVESNQNKCNYLIKCWKDGASRIVLSLERLMKFSNAESWLEVFVVHYFNASVVIQLKILIFSMCLSIIIN